MDCAGCAMNKDPSNLRGPHQSEGLQQFWGASRNLRGLSNLRNSQQSERPQQFWGAPRNLWFSSNLRAHSNMMGPQHSGRPSLNSLRGLTNLRGPSNPRGPSNLRAPAIWKDLSNLKGPGNLRGLSPAIWGAPNKLRGPGNLKAGPLRTVVISLKLSSDAVNEVNHLRNCSTVTLCSELCQLHSVCTACMLLKLSVTVATC